ncbi:HypC/HybG/HupF family hydrogenase formation chaperone [Candidatus Parcubacteria bacterium]|nr:HypC/HybG/HupF family hydrogenase formation chaperone [Patescibacteria group bacterium]MBU4309715.1 HypC/HybG/HupF family hydrogenase formation chaperone [Patescibacteria group bacterium]MBU4431661.1 HypC/HybG/HupF family hydrogenase formation chaperone [Patescibacteria group bacterium]MBU4577897.1 HypC/HybG/HupF family hydrogenase formation chaperone [Patescibacteria group bacterium]MCG2696593.1 HypC/HybG/HupF family hydrogenase formation chaperone [Candidatus Parcubacteria bacterium]
MCLAIPGKIISIKENKAEADFMGARKDVNISLIDFKLNPGDYVLVHAGFVIQRLSTKDAKNSLDAHNKILIK